MAYLLHHLLSESAAKYPDKEAIVFENDSITYAELDAESNRLAHGLLELGLERGARVGIYMNRRITALTSVFGALKAGATYVPIDPLCPSGRLGYMMNKCGIKFLLSSRDKLAAIEQVFPAAPHLEGIIVMNGLASGPRASGPPTLPKKLVDWPKMREAAKPDTLGSNTIDTDLAYILFTSGSTGNPKGVMLSHLNALTFVNSAHDFFKITTNDRLSNICPLHFDMSVFDLFVALKAGATVIVIPETIAVFPVRLIEVIEKSRISVWNSVPSALSLLATHTSLDRHDLSSLRLVLFAGERFPLKYLRRLKEAIPSARFFNMYGQTEANSSTYYRVDQLPSDSRAALPIGRSLPNFDVFALDEDGNLVTGPGREGELFIRASTVAAGYWGEAEKTEQAFVKNPLRPGLSERVYRTGDLVQLDSGGNFVFLGRKDHMIKSRGFRIELGEIETVLCDHPGIRTAVVIPVPDELVGNRLTAVVVPLKPGAVSKEDIARHCSRQLPRYMVPEFVEFRDFLPATSSGKVDRKKLSESYESAARFLNRPEPN